MILEYFVAVRKHSKYNLYQEKFPKQYEFRQKRSTTVISRCNENVLLLLNTCLKIISWWASFFSTIIFNVFNLIFTYYFDRVWTTLSLIMFFVNEAKIHVTNVILESLPNFCKSSLCSVITEDGWETFSKETDELVKKTFTMR